MSAGARHTFVVGFALAAAAATVVALGTFHSERRAAEGPAAGTALENGRDDATTSATTEASAPAHAPKEAPAMPEDKPRESPKRAWAEPVTLAGAGNCFKVSESLYRGEQPTAEGFKSLKALGIKTVINLRAFHSDADEIEESGVEGFETVRISFKTWHAEDGDVVLFLKTVGDPAKAPVFVHCMHGSDRTGLMCAIYRVAVQGWSKDEALKEMTEGPYGFHSIWSNLPKYFTAMDVDKLRRDAGLTP